MSVPPPGRQATEILQSARGWNRVEAAAQQVLDVSPTDRPRALDAICAGDDEFRQAVERIVDALESSGGFLESPAIHRLLTAGSSGAGLIEIIRPPERLGPYRLLRKLGVGGMGSVWLALNEAEDTARPVAVKWLPPFVDRETRKRFDTERRALAAIRHPNVVRFLDDGSGDDGHPYLVTEFVDGVPIDVHCAHRRLPLARRLEFILDLCSALQEIHRHGLVHRDLKPANVLVTASGEVKVVDFGIARSPRSIHGFESSLTRTGTRPMTPGYASPEQIAGDKITPATDVHGAGLLLYELVTGRRAYAREERSMFLLQQQICDGPVPVPSLAKTAAAEVQVELDDGGTSGLAPPDPPHVLRRALLRALDPVVARCLAKRPDQRFPSARELARAVARARQRLRHVGRRRGIDRLRCVAPIAALAAGLLLLSGARGTEQSLRPDPAVTEHLEETLAIAHDAMRTTTPIALLPIDPADTQTSWPTARAVDTQLRRVLTRLPEARLVGSVSSERTARMRLDPVESAKYLRASYLLRGWVSDADVPPVVRLRVFRAVDGQRVFETSFPVFGDDARAVVVELAEAMKLPHVRTQDLIPPLGPWHRGVAEELAVLASRRNLSRPLSKLPASAHLERALAMDSESAWARLERARVDALAICAGGRRTSETRRAMEELLRSHPHSAEVWNVAAMVRIASRDWLGASLALRRAIEVGGDEPDTLRWAAMLSLSQGLDDLAMGFASLAVEADPVSAKTHMTTGTVLLRQGRDELALAALKRASALEPRLRALQAILAEAHWLAGRADEARRVAELEGNESFRTYALAMTHDSSAPESKDPLARLRAERQDMAYQIAVVSASRGDRSDALRWLEIAEARGDCGLLFAPTERMFQPLRRQPRFRALLERFDLALPAG